MSDVFISYARSTAAQAQAVADALREAGHEVWLDDALPAHRTYAEVIAERLKAAKAVVVLWSAEAVKSQWVQSEADKAREDGKLVQLTLADCHLPMPFDRIQCADLSGWTGDLAAPGWRKVAASVAELVGGEVRVAEAPPPLPGKPSIAVLPFVNLSGDAEQEYFADGMVVEIVSALTRIRSIFVIASGSSLSLKGKGLSPVEAARRLGVRYVLEGSVRKAGGRVRIAVQLIDAADGAQMWTHRFEDTLEDVFALQDTVALAVAGQIEPTVLEAEIRRVSSRQTNNMSSYDLVLRALPLMRNYTKADMFEALALNERAIALDADYGVALAQAAVCHHFIALYRWSDDLDGHAREGAELAHRAVRSAGDDARVLASAATVLSNFGRELETAVSLVDRATALNPGAALAWTVSGLIRVRAGEPDVAAEHVQIAMRLDPMGPDRPAQLAVLGLARFFQRRFGEAITLEKEALEQRETTLMHVIVAASHGHLGQSAAAREALDHYWRLTTLPIEESAGSYSRDPAHTKLFLDGIALAEGDGAGESGGCNP